MSESITMVNFLLQNNKRELLYKFPNETFPNILGDIPRMIDIHIK